MVVGRRFWILIWYGILLLGVLGLFPSIYWGSRTHWKNLDETLRAVGTITVSVGMLLLLNGIGGRLGQLLLVLALICFAVAFVLGRKRTPIVNSDQ
jgi:hypothetical protein